MLDEFINRLEVALKGSSESRRVSADEFTVLSIAQQRVMKAFFEDGVFCNAMTDCLAYIGSRVIENESVLLPGHLETAVNQYNNQFGKSVEQDDVAILLSIPGLRERLGFLPRHRLLEYDLAEFELTRLAVYAILHGVSCWDDMGTPAQILCEKYNFVSDYYINGIMNDVLQPWMADNFINDLLSVRSFTSNFILGRILTVYESLSDKSVGLICDQLFKDNDIRIEQVPMCSNCRVNTDRIAAYIDAAFTESLHQGKPQYLYGRALFYAASKGSKFSLRKELETACTTSDTKTLITSLACLSLGAWLKLRGHNKYRSWSEEVTATKALSEKLVDLVSHSGSPAVYYAAVMLVFDLYLLDEFDNSLLAKSSIVEIALKHLDTTDAEMHSAPEKLLGILPLTVRLPSKMARIYCPKYLRAIRTGEYNWRILLYIRILFCCGAWRREEETTARYKQLFDYLYENGDNLAEEDLILVRLLRRELPSIIKNYRTHDETSRGVFNHKPSKLMTCVLACRADDLLQHPNQAAFSLSALEAQLVLYLARRLKNGYDDGLSKEEVDALFAFCKLDSAEVGSFLVVQWFQQLCNRDLAEAARRFYEQYGHILNRPWMYPTGIQGGSKDAFDCFHRFMNCHSRLEMAVFEALHYDQTAVAQMFSDVATAPKNLPNTMRDKLSRMLSDHLSHKLLPVELIRNLLLWEDDTFNMLNNPGRTWHKFYDDRGVACFLTERQPDFSLLRHLCDFGYAVDKAWAKQAVEANEMVYSCLSPRLKNDSQILEVLLKED